MLTQYSVCDSVCVFHFELHLLHLDSEISDPFWMLRLPVFGGSATTVNWNAQGPVKVEDVYSCENIPGAFPFFKLRASL
jgi:hypothetical protein